MVVTTLVLSDKSENSAVWISAAAGLLAELAGGTFLYLYKNIYDQTNKYHDKLTDDQNMLIAIALLDRIEHKNSREDVIIGLIAALSKRTSIRISDNGKTYNAKKIKDIFELNNILKFLMKNSSEKEQHVSHQESENE